MQAFLGPGYILFHSVNRHTTVYRFVCTLYFSENLIWKLTQCSNEYWRLTVCRELCPAQVGGTFQDRKE